MSGKQTGKKSVISQSELKALSPFARNVAAGLIESIDFVRGEGGSRLSEIELPDPAPVYDAREIAHIRKQLGMTQVRFARLVNVSTTSVENWERGVKKPSPASCRLLQLASSRKAMLSFMQLTQYNPDLNASKKSAAKAGRNGR